MKTLQRKLTPWNLLILGTGLLLLLAAAVNLTHVSGASCGRLLFGRYSIPYFATLVAFILVGAGLIWAAFALDAACIRRWLGRLLLVGFGVFVGLALMEVYLRAAEELPPSIDDMRYENHDVLGYMRKPNWTTTAKSRVGDEYTNTFSTDELGLIIRDDNPNYPRPDAQRILMLGDSFVEGVEVPVMANMSEILEDGLSAATGQQYQVINLGHASYGPITYYLSYRVFADYYDPQVVVAVLFIANDFTYAARYYLADRVVLGDAGHPLSMRPLFNLEARTQWNADDLRETPLPVRENYRRRGGIYTLRFIKSKTILPLCETLEEQHPSGLRPEVPLDEPCADVSGKLTKACNNYLLRNDSLVRNNFTAIFKDTYTPLDLEDINYTLEPLALLADTVQRDGRAFLLVLMPQKAQVPGQPGAPYVVGLVEGDYIDSTQPQDVVLALCDAEDITCLDLLPAMRAHSDEMLFWLYDQHLTPAGHRVAAEAIAAALLEGDASGP